MMNSVVGAFEFGTLLREGRHGVTGIADRIGGIRG